MGIGYQSGPGQAPFVPFTVPGQGGDVARTVIAPSEGLQLQREALDFQKGQLPKLQGFQAQQSALDRAFQGGQGDANRNLAMWQQSSRQGFEGQQGEAARALQLALQGNQLGFQGTQAGLDRDFQGNQATAQRNFEGQQGEANRTLQWNLGMAPINLAREKFDTVFPFVQQLGGSLLGGSSGNQLVGGTNTAQRQLPPEDVFGPQQVDRQVNAAKSQNATAAAAQTAQNERQLAGRGFGAHSPLLAALSGQAQAARMAQDATADREIRSNASAQNAQNRLAVSQLGEQQFQDANDADIRRRQMAYQGPAALLSALGSFL
jgi:hypothetical protein